MPKTVRRFQLQPALEGLDHRIAPSAFAASIVHPVGHAPVVAFPIHVHTNVGVFPPGGGGTSPPPPKP